ncbi:hypothetical protein MNBD_GAMMA10-3194 [hydrothermal vent metagenome]|uniref:Lipoprotein n=1 Tax=hydrothermal vent metagenome TaxID=652676 RepID=A0A3B0YQR9_9ZZZZ
MVLRGMGYQAAFSTAIFLFMLLGLGSCGFFETEQSIATDKAQRREVLQGLASTYWQGAKISVRSLKIGEAVESIDFAAIKKQQQSELQLGKHLSRIYDWEFLLREEEPDVKALSVSELVELAQEIYQMSDTIKSMDEDDYPTMMQVISNSRIALKKEPIELPEHWNNSMEHWAFAVVMESRFGFGSWKSYELSKMKIDDFKTTDLKVFSSVHKAIDELRSEWFYLAEQTLTQALDALEREKITLMPGSQGLFSKANTSENTVEQQFKFQMKALIHLLRGFARKQTKRVELEALALEDVQAAVNNFSLAGVDNELVWLAESYLYIKNEEPEKAIQALTKLEGSRYIGKKEKKIIQETVQKIKDRDPDGALNLLTDKIIMYKLGMSYAVSYFNEIEWLKILEKTEEGRAMLVRFKELEQEYQKAKKYLDIDELSRKSKALLNME